MTQGGQPVFAAKCPRSVVEPNNSLPEKRKSNLEEVSALGGELIVFADNKVEMPAELDRGPVIKIDSGGNFMGPAAFTVPLHFSAYHVAVLRGTDLDQTCNLANSVTVE